MKHIKLFEDHNNTNTNEDFYFKMFLNGMLNDKQEFMDLAISKGFDPTTKTNKDRFIYECELVADFNAMKYVDIEVYNNYIENTTELNNGKI